MKNYILFCIFALTVVALWQQLMQFCIMKVKFSG